MYTFWNIIRDENYLENEDFKNIFLSNSLAIFFYLDARFCNNWAFVFLSINTLKLFEKNMILTYFDYFLGCFYIDSFNIEGTTNIKNVYTKNICEKGFYA